MPLLSTITGAASGAPANDCFGSKTASAGTEITRVVPPRTGLRARVTGFSYLNSTTAHTLTMQVCIATTTISSEAASGQAVFNLSTMPTSTDGSILAAADWLILQHEDYTWDAYKVSSLSALAVTATGNLAAKVLKGSFAFFMGAPADHTNRQFTMPASVQRIFTGSEGRACAATATKDFEPILVNSNNATAAGTLEWLSYSYGDA